MEGISSALWATVLLTGCVDADARIGWLSTEVGNPDSGNGLYRAAAVDGH